MNRGYPGFNLHYLFDRYYHSSTKLAVHEIFLKNYNNSKNISNSMSKEKYFSLLQKHNLIDILINSVELYKKYIHTTNIRSIYNVNNSGLKSNGYNCFCIDIFLGNEVITHFYIDESIYCMEIDEEIEIFNNIYCIEEDKSLRLILKESNTITEKINSSDSMFQTIGYGKEEFRMINGKRYRKIKIAFPFYAGTDELYIRFKTKPFTKRSDAKIYSEYNLNPILIETITIPRKEYANLNKWDKNIYISEVNIMVKIHGELGWGLNSFIEK